MGTVSEALKRTQRKYFKSLKGRLSLRKYTQSEKGKLKRKVTVKKAQQKYFKTDKGKASIRRYQTKRREGKFSTMSL